MRSGVRDSAKIVVRLSKAIERFKSRGMKMKRHFFAAVAVLSLTATAVEAEATRVGAHFYQNLAVSPSSVTVIVPASANVSGIEIKTCDVAVASGTAIAIMALYPDGTEHAIFHVFGVSSGVSQQCPYPLSIPPGIQLGVVSGIGTQNSIGMTYDLLN